MKKIEKVESQLIKNMEESKKLMNDINQERRRRLQDLKIIRQMESDLKEIATKEVLIKSEIEKNKTSKGDIVRILMKSNRWIWIKNSGAEYEK